ncbi:hypothetical protein AKJ09_05772 [Labilithrix luteola]|uniref:Uncharacterized protein n=1 Tax=Labilithrix luteola TaxID=1391654 RepID=A0A0K1Q001_9BACT|nr:hypothetical protein AKJ09_05772 [Labilithrix luteola]
MDTERRGERIMLHRLAVTLAFGAIATRLWEIVLDSGLSIHLTVP